MQSTKPPISVRLAKNLLTKIDRIREKKQAGAQEQIPKAKFKLPTRSHIIRKAIEQYLENA